MKDTNFIVINFLFLILTVSCSMSSRNQESEDSKKNDSIINVQLKALIDSTLLQQIGLELDSFIISNSFKNSDTIKEIKATGRSSFFDYEELNIAGSYKISHNLIICKSLKAIHSDIGSVFDIYEMYDTLLTYRMDSLTFLKKNQVNKERRIEKMNDYLYRVERAYSNQTKVHFGISREEYNRLGEDFQRNFYEGLIGNGAFELAKPIFAKGLFVGFEISEIKKNDDFSYYNVQNNAKLVRNRQYKYGEQETFFWVYFCEIYNMEIMSRYDKFDRRRKKTLKAYWNEWIKVYI